MWIGFRQKHFQVGFLVSAAGQPGRVKLVVLSLNAALLPTVKMASKIFVMDVYGQGHIFLYFVGPDGQRPRLWLYYTFGIVRGYGQQGPSKPIPLLLTTRANKSLYPLPTSEVVKNYYTVFNSMM